jgi:hypothetical protein
MRELSEALGALLTDPGLRELFARSPEAAADRVAVAERDRHAFVTLPLAHVARQADGLIEKRLHEGVELFRRTAALHGERTAPLFRAYAASAWPHGARRRWQDIAGFFAFLEARGERVDPAEAHRARFHAGERRLSIHGVRRYPARGALRPALQILWRRGGRVREIALQIDAFPARER